LKDLWDWAYNQQWVDGLVCHRLDSKVEWASY
jgi:hypothetical protein